MRYLRHCLRIHRLTYSQPVYYYSAPATPAIDTLSLHDALPICLGGARAGGGLHVRAERAGEPLAHRPGDRGGDEGVAGEHQAATEPVSGAGRVGVAGGAFGPIHTGRIRP